MGAFFYSFSHKVFKLAHSIFMENKIRGNKMEENRKSVSHKRDGNGNVSDETGMGAADAYNATTRRRRGKTAGVKKFLATNVIAFAGVCLGVFALMITLLGFSVSRNNALASQLNQTPAAQQAQRQALRPVMRSALNVLDEMLPDTTPSGPVADDTDDSEDMTEQTEKTCKKCRKFRKFKKLRQAVQQSAAPQMRNFVIESPDGVAHLTFWQSAFNLVPPVIAPDQTVPAAPVPETPADAPAVTETPAAEAPAPISPVTLRKFLFR
jgi:hypothetical protein